MIMDKFQKRVKKISRPNENAVVIGDGFGNLGKILEIFDTVFLIGGQYPAIKAKNLVYKESYHNLHNLTLISAIFFDLKTLDQLEELKTLWQRNNSVVIIEGDDPIGRELSKALYDTGWSCTSLQGFFHVWEKIK